MNKNFFLVLNFLVLIMIVVGHKTILKALPIIYGCNSVHDCIKTNNQPNNLTCDYASSTCKACAGFKDKCDPTIFTYRPCCPNLSCNHNGVCEKL